MQVELIASELVNASAEWSDKLVFVRPVGKGRIIFLDPYEFHMGAYGWKCLIDGFRASQSLNAAVSQGGFQIPGHYAPWSYDGALLITSRWHSSFEVFGTDSDYFHSVSLPGLPMCLQASPSTGTLAVCTQRFASVYDFESKASQALRLPVSESAFPFFFWLHGIDDVFCLTFDDASRHSSIFRFDRKSGDTLDTVTVNPVSFIPYEERDCASLGRDRFSLIIGPGCGGVGAMLDYWRSPRFDRDNNVLTVRVYRPIGGIVTGNFGPGVKVQDIEAKIRVIG